MKFLLHAALLGQNPLSRSRSPIERCDDGVLYALGDIVPVPLSDAGATSVGEHRPTSLLEGGCRPHYNRKRLGSAVGASPWMPSRSMVARTCSEPGVMLLGCEAAAGHTARDGMCVRVLEGVMAHA